MRFFSIVVIMLFIGFIVGLRVVFGGSVFDYSVKEKVIILGGERCFVSFFFL